jgi:hypothetical protein
MRSIGFLENVTVIDGAGPTSGRHEWSDHYTLIHKKRSSEIAGRPKNLMAEDE